MQAMKIGDTTPLIQGVRLLQAFEKLIQAWSLNLQLNLDNWNR